jgi:hypothetical protein
MKFITTSDQQSKSQQRITKLTTMAEPSPCLLHQTTFTLPHPHIAAPPSHHPNQTCKQTIIHLSPNLQIHKSPKSIKPELVPPHRSATAAK